MTKRRATLAASILGAVAARASAAPFILNEYNAVADANFLEFDPVRSWEGRDHGAILDATLGSGTSTTTGLLRDGRVKGNGANWIELVVVQDRLDVRGWTLEWSNSDPDAGSVTFSNHALWSNLRGGTIITIIEEGVFTAEFDDGTFGPQINLGTNPSFSPQRNDWWMNFDVDDTPYFTQNGFKVDNDNWQMTIKDAQGAVVFGPVGEAVPGGWGGGGLNSQEVAVMSADPDVGTPLDFDDNDYSTLGAPNRFNQNSTVQDFTNVRTWWTNRIPGDANVDGRVNLQDFNILAANFGATGVDWFFGDFTGDELVNLADFNILAANFGFSAAPLGPTPDDWAALSTAIPEPTALALAGIAGVCLLRRRR